MDQATDVGRLFSWLKGEDLRYREFAGAREIADATATWPAVHKVAAETGHADEGVAPLGDAAAKERIARDRMTLPPVALEAVRTGRPVSPAPPTLGGGRLLSALGRRMQSARAARAAEAGTLHEPMRGGTEGGFAEVEEAELPIREHAAQEHVAQDPLAPDATRDHARASAERLRDRLDAAMAVNPRPTAPVDGGPGRGDPYPSARPAARSQRGVLFGGAYSGRETERTVASEAPRRGQSLQAVFSRLSGSRGGTLRDPRERARSTSGLGSVFGRLR
jgi:hypothetical protein